MDGALVLAATLTPGTLTAGLVTWAVTRAASRDGAQPDRLVGVRTRATRASSRAWAAGHRSPLPTTRAGAVLAVVVTAVVVLVVIAPASPAVGTIAGVVAVVGPVAVVGCC